MIDENQSIKLANEYLEKTSNIKLESMGATLNSSPKPHSLHVNPTWSVWFRFPCSKMDGERVVYVDAITAEAWEVRAYPADLILEDEAIDIAKDYLQRMSNIPFIFIDTVFNPEDEDGSNYAAPTWSVMFRLSGTDIAVQRTVNVNAETGEPWEYQDN